MVHFWRDVLSSWVAGGHWQQAIAILEALLEKKVGHIENFFRTIRLDTIRFW